MLHLMIAIPAFARMYNVSCKMCHVAFPKLNGFGQAFADNGYVFAGKQGEIYRNLGDDRARTFKELPLAVRFTHYVAASYDGGKAMTDFQSPWSVKFLLGGAPNERINFYAYVIFEKGLPPFFEDAWIDLHGFFGLPFSLTLGQFQISDLMFMRETRLTRSDFYIYKVGPYKITYHRGALLGTPIGDFGVVNGNGLSALNGKYYDDNPSKWFFGHLPLPADFGLFGLWGEDYDTLGNYVRLYRLGLDWRGVFESFYPFFQILVGFDNDTSNLFYGGFFGVDYAPGGDGVVSLLFNYVDAPANSPYRNERLATLALRYSHYVLTNLKVFAEGEGWLFKRSLALTLGVDFAF
ncbi:MAG: hypothetical protein GXO29_07530 [Thermotogae bacterium]|nr:hypothetical protein [Thermotogota bacterium]